MKRLAFSFCLLAAGLLAGCEMPGGDSAEKLAAVREAEGKAIGSACRHAGRAIEDCYVLNRKFEKASIFAGWRDMNDYMRENKIEAVAPTLASQQLASARQEGKGAPAADTRPAEAKAASSEARPAEAEETPVVIEKKPARSTPKEPREARAKAS